MKNTIPKLVSLILPCYNEAESLPALVYRLKLVVSELRRWCKVEVLFVDDGSKDNTLDVLGELRSQLPHQVISLSRNFGHQAALYAGLHQAKGDVVISLDADLQHPPELIPTLIAKYVEGNDIVLTQRSNDQELPFFKRITSHYFYQVLNIVSTTSITQAASDYRLLARQVVDAIVALPEQRVFLRGIVSWVGFQTITIPYQADKRVAGNSKYSMLKMIRLALAGLTAFSTLPLYLATIIGCIFSFLTIVYAIYVIYIWLWSTATVPGWSSVILVVLSTATVISFLFAVVGVYVAAIYEEVKHRPLFIIKQVRKSHAKKKQ